MTEEHPEQQEDVKPKINLVVDFEGQSKYNFSVLSNGPNAEDATNEFIVPPTCPGRVHCRGRC